MHAAWEIKTVADVKKEFEMQISSCEVVGPWEMFLLIDALSRPNLSVLEIGLLCNYGNPIKVKFRL